MLKSCGCRGCKSGAMLYDRTNRMHVNFCTRCGRAYCYGSGPSRVSCSCCRRCKNGKCKKPVAAEPKKDGNSKKKANGSVKRPVAEPSNTTKTSDGATTKEQSNKKAKIDGNGDDVKQKATAGVPFAKQSDVRVVSVSSTEQPHDPANVLKDDNGETCWKSEKMPRKMDKREQYVEFAFDPYSETIRRIGSVEVDPAKGLFCDNFRLDFSLDGIAWVRGPVLWGMSSCGQRSHMQLDFEANRVRVVCEKKQGCSGLLVEQLGFGHVHFNRCTMRHRFHGSG